MQLEDQMTWHVRDGQNMACMDRLTEHVVTMHACYLYSEIWLL
jgi:hypothetical protein